MNWLSVASRRGRVDPMWVSVGCGRGVGGFPFIHAVAHLQLATATCCCRLPLTFPACNLLLLSLVAATCCFHLPLRGAIAAVARCCHSLLATCCCHCCHHCCLTMMMPLLLPLAAAFSCCHSRPLLPTTPCMTIPSQAHLAAAAAVDSCSCPLRYDARAQPHRVSAWRVARMTMY